MGVGSGGVNGGEDAPGPERLARGGIPGADLSQTDSASAHPAHVLAARTAAAPEISPATSAT